MGAKRRAGSKSPTKREPAVSPKAKKAKVEEDPVADLCQELVQFFGSYADIPEAIEATLTGSIQPSLYKLAAERHQLEQFYATAVGEVLRHCVQAIDLEVVAAQAHLTVAEQEQQAQAQAVELAAQAVTLANENVGKAKAAQQEAQAAADQADEDRTATQEEVEQLDVTKAKLVSEETELKEGLAGLQTQGSKKETAKLCKLLEAVGVSASCISAVPAAMGKTGGFEEMVLGEASKALQGKADEVGQKLRDFDTTSAQTVQKLADTDAKIAALAEQLTARQAELKAAADAEKAAKAARKEAEGALASKKKTVTSKAKANALAGEKKAAATAAEQTYQALLTRAAPEPEPVAELAERVDGQPEEL